MPFTARDILWAVQTALQDGGNRRWTLEELRVYLNDGLKQIAFFKPSAVSHKKSIPLVAGTYQELEDGELLLRALKNGSGGVVTPIDRAILDSQFANWHNSSSVPFSPNVTHVMMDEENPRAFYVFPGNTGGGTLEAIVSRAPEEVEAPENPLDIEAYTAEIDIPTLYENCLRDYVLSRAFEKDAAIPGALQRAAAYRQSFNDAIGVKSQVEAANNINTST